MADKTKPKQEQPLAFKLFNARRRFLYTARVWVNYEKRYTAGADILHLVDSAEDAHIRAATELVIAMDAANNGCEVT